MKLIPFDLEAAKSGKAIVCRNQTSTEFIAHVPTQPNPSYRLIAMLPNGAYHYYFEDGTIVSNGKTDLDLFMVPEKKTVWVNIYSNICFSRFLFESKEQADKCNTSAGMARIACVPVTYTEGEGL